MTEVRMPTEQQVLHVLPRAWTSTHAVYLRWLGDDHEPPRPVRNDQRAEVHYQLDRLSLTSRVAKRTVAEGHDEWMRVGSAEDIYTNTVEDAAQFERNRAGE